MIREGLKGEAIALKRLNASQPSWGVMRGLSGREGMLEL